MFSHTPPSYICRSNLTGNHIQFRQIKPQSALILRLEFELNNPAGVELCLQLFETVEKFIKEGTSEVMLDFLLPPLLHERRLVGPDYKSFIGRNQLKILHILLLGNILNSNPGTTQKESRCFLHCLEKHMLRHNLFIYSW